MKHILLLVLATLCSCEAVHVDQPTSQMVASKMFSEQLNDSLSYKLYLPANYEQSDSLPIIYLLHGHGGSDSTWLKKEEGNIKWTLDSLIKNQSIPPLLAATVDAGNTWYVDSHKKMESTLIKEFIPYLEKSYQENIAGHYRIIAGNSAGGYGTVRLALKYPDLFKSAILLSPAAYYPLPPPNSSSRKINVFSSDSLLDIEIWKTYAYPNISIDSNKIEDYPFFYISTGDDDEYEIVDVVTQLRSYFLEVGIQHELTIINGGHDWLVWKNRFEYDLINAFKHYQSPPQLK